EIVHQTRAETRRLSVALPPGVRFDQGDGLLPGWNGVAPLAFDNFDIDAMALEHVVIEAVAGQPAAADGGFAAWRKRFDGATLLGVSRLTIDRAGRIVEASAPMAGAGIAIRLSDKQSALGAYVPYRVLTNTMMKSPYLISTSAMHGHIRYRFAFRDG